MKKVAEKMSVGGENDKVGEMEEVQLTRFCIKNKKIKCYS